MLCIKNMSFAPIEGPYDSNVISLSKKIAGAYNKSVQNLNSNLFLGFKFENIKELKNYKASLNFKNRVLEINISESTKILIPSLYASPRELAHLFEFSKEKEFKDEIILERAINSHSVQENFRLKGKADSIFSGIKSGVKSAKNYFSSDITIQNPDSVTSLAENITSDLSKILSIDAGKDRFLKVIEDFIKHENKDSVDKLYEAIFNTAVKTKYVENCISNIKDLVSKKRKEGEIKGNIDDDEILKLVAKSYNVKEKDITSRNEKDIVGVIKKIYTYITKGLSILINSIKGLTFTAAAYETFNNGVGSLVLKIIKYTISGCLNVIQYFVQTDSNAVQAANAALTGDSSVLDKVAATLTKANEFFIGKGIDSIDYGQSWILDKLSIVSSSIESLPYIGVVKYLLFVFLAAMALKYIYNIVRDIFKIKDENQTDAEKIFARISEENLSNNFGFDKILATEGIIIVVVSHLENAIKSGRFSKEEKSRLKGLISAFYSSHKKKTKEGIKFFFNEMSLN